MEDDGIFATDKNYSVPDFNKREEKNDSEIVVGFAKNKSDNDNSYHIKMKSIFKNDTQNFAILNAKQLKDSLQNLSENGINCEIIHLYDFDLSCDEHLIPEKLFYKDNVQWYYDYHIFYKIKKMLSAIFPGYSALNNLGFFYCKEQHAPLFIVNNTKEIELCLALSPIVYV